MSVPSPPSTTTSSAERPISASSVVTSTPRSRRNCAASPTVSVASGLEGLCTIPTRRGAGQGCPFIRVII